MAPRQRPTIPIAGAVLALVGFGGAVALVGAGSVAPDRGGGSSQADTVVVAAAILIGAGALAFTIFVAQRTTRPRRDVSEPDEQERPPPGFLLRPLLVPVLTTLLLLGAYALLIGPCLSDKDSGRRARPPTTSATVGPRPDASPTSESRPNWTVVTGLVLGVAGLALALAAARNRRPPFAESPSSAIGDEIALSLADLDSLDDDPDHRRVVIRTYARMERALGRTGNPRLPSETSQEFLRRALRHLGASAGPAQRLTDLFEVARFSSHPIDQSMRADAAAALRTVRDDIAPAAPAAPAEPLR